jgi:hypothetical protein
VPGLFAGRLVVLPHGDFAPVNILSGGEEVTGLLDFEAVRSPTSFSTPPGGPGR